MSGKESLQENNYTEEELIRNTERYGDSNEVNYDLIFEQMILKNKVKEFIKLNQKLIKSLATKK